MGAANPAMNRDDQPLPPQPEISESEAQESESILTSSIMSHKSFYPLSSSSPTEVISSLVLEGSSTSTSKRTPVDLVLVIDVSGSMSGEKLDLVKKTLEFLLTQLGPNDRVSLVTFNGSGRKLIKLTCCDEAGKKKFSNLIRGLNADGSTNLVEGLNYGLCVLSGRRVVNQSSAIILLTDGQDDMSATSVARAKEVIEKVKVAKEYSIHCFGYGSDHDATLLNAISDSKSGGFYFIDQFESIAQAFANCLGEVMSILFDSIHVTLQTLNCEIPFKLTKVFSETEDISFTLPALLRGVKKEVVFVIELAQGEITEDSIEVQPLKALISYHNVKKDQSLTSECLLNIVIKKTIIEESPVNQEVISNYYRFKAAEALKKAGALGDHDRLEEAKQELDDCIDSLQNSDIASHHISPVLTSELQRAKANFQSSHHYQHAGKISNIKSAKAHFNKRGEDIDLYQNDFQSEMIVQSKNYFSSH